MERVKQLLYGYKLHELDDEGFRNEAEAILNDYGRHPPTFQDFGMVVEERLRKRPREEADQVWAMLNGIEPRIKSDLDHWRNAMAK